MEWILLSTQSDFVVALYRTVSWHLFSALAVVLLVLMHCNFLWGDFWNHQIKCFICWCEKTDLKTPLKHKKYFAALAGLAIWWITYMYMFSIWGQFYGSWTKKGMIYVSLCGPEVSGPFDLFTVVTYPNNARDGY